MALTTIPGAGAKLRGTILNALVTELRPISVIKSGDTSRNTTITRTADPDLTIALPASSNWKFECVLYLNSATNAAGDFSGEFAFPVNATCSVGTHGLVDTIASGLNADLVAFAEERDSTSPTGSFSIGCSTNITAVLIMGSIEMGATAGNLVLNWAQSSSNANNTNIQSGSRLSAWRLS